MIALGKSEFERLGVSSRGGTKNQGRAQRPPEALAGMEGDCGGGLKGVLPRGVEGTDTGFKLVLKSLNEFV